MPPKNPNKFKDSYIRFIQDVPQESNPYYFEVSILEGVVKPILGKYSSGSKENMYIVVGVSTKEPVNECHNEIFYWLELNHNSLTKGDVITCCIRREEGGTCCKLWKNGKQFGIPQLINNGKTIYPTIGLNSRGVVLEVKLGNANKGILIARYQNWY